jgi:AcrR family transcriptional regulator
MLTRKQKDKIYVATTLCLKETGLEKMTLKDVANRSGINEKKLKEEYPDGNSLMREMMSRGIDHLTGLLEKSLNARGKADVKISRFVKSLLEDYENHAPLYKLVSLNFESLNKDSLLLRDLLTQDQIDRYRRNTMIIGRIIADGQSDGIFRKADPLECAFFLRGLINSAILYWSATKYEGRLDDFADRVMKILLTGIYK